MHPALLTLWWLRIRSRIRHTLRGLKTPRGAVFFALGLAMILIWLGSAVSALLVAPTLADSTAPPEVPLLDNWVRDLLIFIRSREMVTALVPAFLLIHLLTLLTWENQPIHFTPAEVDFLFAGPFSRRQLLGYKLATTTTGMAITALLLSIVLPGTSWLANYIGAFLALMFLQLSSIAVVLLRQTVTTRLYTRARKLALLLVLALLAAAVVSAGTAGPKQAAEFFSQLGQSWSMRALLAPISVFTRTLGAEALFPELVGWGTLALLVDLSLFGLVMRLDANYLEAAAAASQRMYEWTQRIQRGGLAAAMQGWLRTKPPRRPLPQLPWVGGAGPIAWRQLAKLRRRSRSLLVLVSTMGVMAAVCATVALSLAPSPQGNSQFFTTPWLLVITIGMTLPMVSFLLTQMVPFDFRSDLDHIDWLRTLPLSPVAIASGQLMTPVLVVTLLQLVVLAAAAALTQAQTASVILGVAAFTLPLNLLFVGLQNLFFLLFPARMTVVSPADFQFFGRQIVIFWAMWAVVMACLGIAAAFGGIAYLLGGGSWTACASVSWLALAGLAATTVPCVASAFRRFDPSLHTPA